MASDTRSIHWQGAGCSVRGASHRRRQTPNQDAIAWTPLECAGDPLIVGVADGHGARTSFRSAIGSALAVDVATRLLGEFVAECGSVTLGDLRAAARDRLPMELTTRWRRAVEEHFAAHPLDGGDLEPGNKEMGRGPHLWYGSTLLAAAATEDFLILMQLGDGDILIVSEDGKVIRPWPRDDRFLGGETPSLCGEDAAAYCKVEVRRFVPGEHQLVILSTDGYANSFRDDQGFLKAGRDILEIIRHEGLGRVEAELETWLRETSDLGSGDDITVGVLWWPPVVGGGDVS